MNRIHCSSKSSEQTNTLRAQGLPDVVLIDLIISFPLQFEEYPLSKWSPDNSWMPAIWYKVLFDHEFWETATERLYWL